MSALGAVTFVNPQISGKINNSNSPPFGKPGSDKSETRDKELNKTGMSLVSHGGN